MSIEIDSYEKNNKSGIRLREPPPDRWMKLNPVIWPPGSGHKAANAWTHRLSLGFNVMRSWSTTKAGDKWIHISLSRPDRMPEYLDLKKVKEDFIGPEFEAYQVFPASVDHVNAHKFCLHLWCPVNGKRAVANLMDLINEEAY